MAITIQEESKLFSIHTRTTTYQFKADENGYLVHTYYGSRIEDDDLYQQIPFVDRGFSPNVRILWIHLCRSIPPMGQEILELQHLG